MPDISIIIVNYNTLDLTRACLRSVFNGNILPTYEVTVIDNASSELHVETLIQEFPRIILIRNATNVGFSKAVNQGIESCTASTYLLLNSDTILHPSTIDHCYHFTRQHSEYGIVTCRLEYPDGLVQHNCQKFPSLRYELILLFRLHKWLFRKKAPELLLGSFFDHRQRTDPDWVWGTFFMFREDILNTNRKLDDRYLMYGEDMLWCYQAAFKNYKVAFLPDACLVHYVGRSGNSDNVAIKQKHEMHFIKTNYNFLHALLLVCGKCLNYLSLSINHKRYWQLMLQTIRLFLTPSARLLLQNKDL